MASSSLILEKKQALEEDLRRIEKQIYDLEGEDLQECHPCARNPARPALKWWRVGCAGDAEGW